MYTVILELDTPGQRPRFSEGLYSGWCISKVFSLVSSLAWHLLALFSLVPNVHLLAFSLLQLWVRLVLRLL